MFRALKYSWDNTSKVGYLYGITQSSDTQTALTLPTGVKGTRRRLRGVTTNGRTILVNAFEVPLVLYPDGKLHRAGVVAPGTKPTVSPSGGSANEDGYFYTTFVYKQGDVELAESAPSTESALVSAAEGATRTWGGLHAANLDNKANWIRGYGSISGNDPRVIWERPIGVTSVVESVPTLSFGKVMSESLGVPPAATMVENFEDRVWWAGDPAHPERVYIGELGQPEGVDPLAWVKTTSGFPVTGIKRQGDRLLVFTMTTCDAILGGFTDVTQVEVKQISPDIGCISHDSIVNIFDRIYFASRQGVYCYDGGWKFLTPKHKRGWKSLMASYPYQMFNSFAEHDEQNYCYLLSIPGANTYRYRICYLPFEPAVGGVGAAPWVSKDRIKRPEYCLGRVLGKLYSGSNDGYLRLQNDTTNANDDSDTGTTSFPDALYTAPKAVDIISKHYFMDDPGGDEQEGKIFTRLWSFVECENYDWRVRLYGGDETAKDQGTSTTWYDDTAASFVSGQVGKTTHSHVPETTAGRGLTVRYQFGGSIDTDGVKSLKWRGFGGTYMPGPATRGSTS